MTCCKARAEIFTLNVKLFCVKNLFKGSTVPVAL